MRALTVGIACGLLFALPVYAGDDNAALPEVTPATHIQCAAAEIIFSGTIKYQIKAGTATPEQISQYDDLTKRAVFNLEMASKTLTQDQKEKMVHEATTKYLEDMGRNPPNFDKLAADLKNCFAMRI